MKIYVASSYANIPEVRVVMGTLMADGHTISHDWTTKPPCNPEWPDAVRTAYLERCGEDDYNGVFDADMLVLVNHVECRDSMTEFGLALGAVIPVAVLYPGRRSSVFFGKATKVDTLAALRALIGVET